MTADFDSKSAVRTGVRVRVPPSAPRENGADPATEEVTADPTATEAFAGNLPDALETALLVAAQAGDAATVARLVELIHDRHQGDAVPIGKAKRNG